MQKWEMKDKMGMNKTEAQEIHQKEGICPYCKHRAVHFGTVRHDDYKCTNPDCNRFISSEKIIKKETN